MPSRPPQPSPEVCPVCGTEVPERARACPGCGADARTGWNEEATAADGLGLPDPEFDYDAYLKREFGSGPPAAPAARIWIIALAVFGVLIGLLWLWRRLQPAG